MYGDKEARRVRFVERHLGSYRDEEYCTRYATIHVGFLRNDKKGTTGNQFIPKEYHQFMQSMDERQMDYHKTRERYHQHTRSGAGPFSWTYNKVRDFVAGHMMKDWNFKHCEIAFDQNMFPRAELTPVRGIPYTEDCLVAFGTNMKDGEIFRKPRTFQARMNKPSYAVRESEEPYEWIHLRVPEGVVRRTIALANQEVGKEYDTKTLERMLTSPVALRPSSQWYAQKWHCTNFTAHVLQQAGFLNGLDPNCLTADDVHYYLKGNMYESTVFSTPATANKNAERVRQSYNKMIYSV